MKKKAFLFLLCALALAGCDYCPRPGTFDWAHGTYRGNPRGYPVPDMSPCAPVAPAPTGM